MKKIATIKRSGLFNIIDYYDIWKDSKGFYGISKANNPISHCGYISLDSALKMKNIQKF